MRTAKNNKILNIICYCWDRDIVSCPGKCLSHTNNCKLLANNVYFYCKLALRPKQGVIHFYVSNMCYNDFLKEVNWFVCTHHTMFDKFNIETAIIYVVIMSVNKGTPWKIKIKAFINFHNVIWVKLEKHFAL
jgi:hypothetical protein